MYFKNNLATIFLYIFKKITKCIGKCADLKKNLEGTRNESEYKGLRLLPRKSLLFRDQYFVRL